MFDHVGIVVRDLGASARFYEQVLTALGLKIVEHHKTGPGEGWVVISSGEPASPFFVIGAGRPSFWTEGSRLAESPAHLCFRAPSWQAVDEFHRLGLACGARDNGGPGIRRQPFYCAFLIDPDGNNVEAGCYLASADAAV